MRRIFKKVYSGNILNKHLTFVYNEYKLIEEKDALASNVVETNEYSPFGKLIATSGNIDNPFKFSSEYYDSETELVYYNYRYYNPLLGRWMSRDPIEEQGGFNLYGMCGNNIILSWDNFGHSDWPWGWTDLIPFVQCVHFGYQIGYPVTKLLTDMIDNSKKMGSTDREKYHDDVMSGKRDVSTQSPSVQNDIKSMSDMTSNAASMPGTGTGGPPQTGLPGVADAINTASEIINEK